MEQTGIALTTLALLLLFGANTVLAVCLWAHERLNAAAAAKYEVVQTSEESSSAVAPKQHAKQLSEPLALNITSIRALSYELFRLGLVVAVPYICEKHPIFPHAAKVHDMDTFWAMVTMLVIACALNVRRGSPAADVLNREQTEEWKGWMQFIFLLYHYFSAHEVYNSVRVMITAYVWMTGFGNFSFFYLKSDFGLVRLLQMLWRLNFLVTLLCLSLGNTYILYYICPLHTFYFCLVYCVMRVWSSANHTTAIRWKLLAAAALIYLVWDTDSGVFSKLFFFLGRTPKIGARSGTLWEWYFRSSLDHWSTLLGMVFALNFPVTALWIKKVEAMPHRQQWMIKGSVAAALLCALVWWAAVILPQPKLQYNSSNAYYGVAIPLLTYIFLRNLTPTLRLHYVEPLHSIGKITLETYLMQHHVWLTSNAKTVLVLVPGSAKLNLVATTLLYVLVSKEAYRLTMSLRGMLLPDSKAACLKNLAGIAGVLTAATALAGMLLTTAAAAAGDGADSAFGSTAGLRGGVIAVTAFVLGLVLTAAVHLALKRGGNVDISSSSSSAAAPYSGGLLSAKALAPAVCGFLLLTGAAHVPLAGFSGSASSSAELPLGEHDQCIARINDGAWTENVGACSGTGGAAAAYCDSHSWQWRNLPQACHFKFQTPAELSASAAGKHIMFIGDSVQRFLYYSTLRSLGHATPDAHDHNAARHSDLSWSAADGSGTTVSFQWAPYAAEAAQRAVALAGNATAAAAASTVDVSPTGSTSAADGAFTKPDVLIMGLGLWDALHTRDVKAYSAALETVHSQLQAPALDSVLKLWLTTTAVVEPRLLTPEKAEWLKEPLVEAYRQAASDSPLMDCMKVVVDGQQLTAPRSGDSYDGIHYADFVYDAVAQLLANAYMHCKWSAPGYAAAASGASQQRDAPPQKAAPQLGSMANPLLGAAVMVMAAVMLFTKDAYHGLAAAALKAFSCSSISWNEAYGPLLAKMGKGSLSELPSVRSVDINLLTDNSSSSSSSSSSAAVHNGNGIVNGSLEGSSGSNGAAHVSPLRSRLNSPSNSGTEMVEKRTFRG